MSRVRVFIKYWLPVAAWSVLIFGVSGDSKSVAHSSRIIGPLVRWLFPQASPETVDLVVFIVRKCAHAGEYAVLAWLFWRAIRKPVRQDARPWNWRVARVTVCLTALYAATDELHQSFVPGRQASVWDVLLDTCGAMLGIILVWQLGRWRKKW
ncbi:MAG: VanZ family protein [Verrucomicrobia bacterium]|nr:MAG: VanZ family protein [Verrucomicrobiota bacterium]